MRFELFAATAVIAMLLLVASASASIRTLSVTYNLPAGRFRVLQAFALEPGGPS